MARHFHRVKIKKVQKETADCVSIEFDIDDNIRPLFNYKQGQNITIKSHLDEVRRTYSICSSPHENKLTVAVKRVPNGVFSSYATETLRAGDELEIMEPAGSFYTELRTDQAKNYLFFAAGSGITPIISIIKSIFVTEPDSTVTLVYGNRNVASIIFKSELEGLKNLYLDRFNLVFIISREPTESPINSGRIDEQKLKDLRRLINYKNADEIFICGPEQMIFTVKEFLESEGIEEKNIHFELFTTPVIKKEVTEKTAPPEQESTQTDLLDKDGVSHVTITVDGRTYEVEVPYKEPTILDAGLNMGINLPYSCKGGVCTTCRAKLLEGKVDMDNNYGLEDDEVADGYILTCQSHPRTTTCKVDYDQ